MPPDDKLNKASSPFYLIIETYPSSEVLFFDCYVVKRQCRMFSWNATLIVMICMHFKKLYYHSHA